ncbi:hypothetical protein SEA_STEAMY_69 [Mycobacterium phage Steamy]|uniref:Uncharacterized protein n=1 Tax=Mycobacterium phage Steamy TaxID=2250309 RepID=A0A345L0P1_9CAUD|nr:hypothetical protein KIV62_gp32 [Mycobacterium phage Steamy]AXH48843.1 hypothetical protein SEA_STEAMY_69 [Mycobacterium phage Steamy]
MPLSHLVSQFEGCSYTKTVTVTKRQGWLWSSKCEAWMDDDPMQVCTILAVYKSPLLRETKTMYMPVRNLILNAGHSDLLAEGVSEDERMIHGRGEWFVSRLVPVGFVESPMCPSLDEVRSVMQQTAERVVTYA